ncbi:MAG: hypothetical protein FJ118_04685 [Deltaproteobacteria bacterium]|nr:hypothetical protein [Deltaproteobacteria bacterium]
MAHQRGAWIVCISSALILAVTAAGTPALAQDYKVFQSEEYGFSIQYPGAWVKIDKPRGNYYKVFQSPDLVGKVRARINVAAHRPVKDSLEVFLNELRNAIKDLQKKAGSREKEPVRILDEGEFKSDIPGSYYFFIQALEDKESTWMDVIIVFFKHKDTLLRVSCLAPSDKIEEFHKTFNNVLLSVKFDVAGREASPSPEPAVRVTPGPGTTMPGPAAREPERPTQLQPAEPTQRGPAAPSRGPRVGPTRPSTDKPPTGIVE